VKLPLAGARARAREQGGRAATGGEGEQIWAAAAGNRQA
jgi:hypothetical protein